MMYDLKVLAKELHRLGLKKCAQVVEELEEDYDEPWHEEAVKEFGDEKDDSSLTSAIPSQFNNPEKPDHLSRKYNIDFEA